MHHLDEYNRILTHLQQDTFKKEWFISNHDTFLAMSCYDYVTLISHLDQYLDVFKDNNMLSLDKFTRLLAIQIGINTNTHERVSKILSLGLSTGCFKLKVDTNSEVYIYLNYFKDKQKDTVISKVVNLQDVLTHSFC